jgi:hypothetical protein
MIPSALCWLALQVYLPLHHTEVPALEKRRNKKGAPKQHGKTTGSRSDPNPRELKRASLQKHPRDQSCSGHKNRGRVIATILASFWRQRTLKV